MVKPKFQFFPIRELFLKTVKIGCLDTLICVQRLPQGIRFSVPWH